MRVDLQKRAVALAAISALGAYSTAYADTPISSFAGGDLVVLRGGDMANPAAGGTVTLGAYLDEFSPAGVYQGTIPVPQTISGSNNPLTLTDGAGNHEGILTLSANGNWLTFGGYDTAPTTGSSGAGISNDTIGEISQTASSVNTSTTLGPATIRAATTVDGNEFWVSNAPGLQYIAGTGSSATDTVLSSLANGYNTRTLQTVNNTLIAGSGSQSLGTHGVWQLGASGTLPTSGTPSKTLLTNGNQQDGTDFIFADEQGDSLTSSLYEGQYNVLYSVGGASGSATINKYEYNGSTFNLLNSETPIQGGSDTLIGVTDIVSGNNVDLYYTDTSGIYEIADSNDANTFLPNNGSLIAAAPSGEFFYGIANTPTVVVASNNLTWNNIGGGDGENWDVTSRNWNSGSSSAIYADGDNVTFNDANNGNYAVTLSSTVSPASVTVTNSNGNYTISGSGSIAGTGSLAKSGSGTLTLSTANTYSGGTIVSAGRLLIEPTSSTTSALPKGALSITGGELQLATNVTQASQSANVPSTAPTSNVNITSLSITGSGAFDIGNNHIIINYGSGPDPIASIATWIADGAYGTGTTVTWTGTGITSSVAAANPSYGIGYADAADAGNPAGLSSGQIEIMYTLLGDANLDGKVNGTDFNLMATNFNQAVTDGWDKGDFNYDGKVNGNDFVLLAANFNQFASQSAVSSGDLAAIDAFATANGISLSSVPEPGSLATISLAAVAVLRRRRRTGAVALQSR